MKNFHLDARAAVEAAYREFPFTMARLEVSEIEEVLPMLNIKEDCEEIRNRLSRRRELINSTFEFSEKNLARLSNVLEIIVSKSDLLRTEAHKMYDLLTTQIKCSSDTSFIDFRIELQLFISFNGKNSVLKIGEETGRDFMKTFEIIEEVHNPIESNLMSSHRDLDSDTMQDIDEIYKYWEEISIGCKNYEDWGEPAFFEKNPQCRELPINYEAHRLLFHTLFSLEDIIRINDIWSEMHVIYLNTTTQDQVSPAS